MISLGGGNPNPSLFPFTGASFELADGAHVGVSDATFVHSLQYNDTEGLPELVARLTRLQIAEHHPPSPFTLAVTPGSQEGITKLFDTLLDEEDTLVVEAPTYAGALSYCDVIGCGYLQIPIDAEGMVPHLLDAALSGWEPTRRKPKIIYLIPTGSNPAGTTMGEARRRAIYALAQAHNLLIIEDDPYYYLSFGAGDAPQPPSFLSLDVDGRVVRTDSFSKVVSAGVRVGYTTGPPALLARVMMANQASLICPSGMSQVAVLALLQHWHVGDAEDVGYGRGRGLLAAHLARVHAFYQGQCDAFVAAAERTLGWVPPPRPLAQPHEAGETPPHEPDGGGGGGSSSSPFLSAHADAAGGGGGGAAASSAPPQSLDGPLVAFTVPTAGMFIWLELLGVKDSLALISERAVEKKVGVATH